MYDSAYTTCTVYSFFFRFFLCFTDNVFSFFVNFGTDKEWILSHFTQHKPVS